ncbi:mitochondrial import receptor subunit Tom22-domain-containing protein [Ephemerocybe angulata]|uniref:Mitochondrial import receptor subunit Tom22-domain-containing protein n=1 Tax=Ephemerocybe angulata TaxID=980116 RepID=A0A8H6M8Q9_9AGAR|nr:mitochondrial import receptor subunit Tom22-domain-containing protein [Tulosesus angulatus]
MVKISATEGTEGQDTSTPYAGSSSSASSSTDSLDTLEFDDNRESIYNRLAALIDIIPPTTRRLISFKISGAASVILRAGNKLKSVLWIISTSALLVVLPLAFVLEKEANSREIEIERDMMERHEGVEVLVGRPLPYPAVEPHELTPIVENDSFRHFFF